MGDSGLDAYSVSSNVPIEIFVDIVELVEPPNKGYVDDIALFQGSTTRHWQKALTNYFLRPTFSTYRTIKMTITINSTYFLKT